MTDTVECPICGDTFEMEARGGVCRNGHQHPDYEGDTDGSDEKIETKPKPPNPEQSHPDTPESKPSEPEPPESGPPEQPTCNHCGADIQKGANFCPQCGDDPFEDVDNEDDDDGANKTKLVCPDCGAAYDEDDKFCSQCGYELAAPAPAVEETSGPDEITLDTDGGEIEVATGEAVGTSLRHAVVNAGGTKEEAKKIHRDHLRFEKDDDGIYLVKNRVNPVVVNGTSLNQDERVKLEDGDTVELSGVIDATIVFP